MESIADIYTQAVRHHLHPLWANWDPSRPVKLGDFGILEDGIFERLSNVASLGIDIGKTIESDADDQKTFTSSDDVRVEITAAGQASANLPVTAKASMSVAFGSKHAAYFNAAGCDYVMVADKIALAKAVMTLLDAGKWSREWAVVTDLVPAKSTTVIISGAANAKIVLEASGSVPNINVANANVGLSVVSEANVGYQIVSSKGLIPLIGLSKVQPRFLWMGDHFKPLSINILRSPHARQILQDSPLVETEPREYLEFSQLE